MKRLVALMICAVSWSGSTDHYPYNPDGNADSLIGVADLQDLLTTYGQGFVPNEILFEGQALSSVLASLQGQLEV